MDSQVSIDSPEVGALYIGHFEGAPKELQSDLKELCWVALHEPVSEFADAENDAYCFSQIRTTITTGVLSPLMFEPSPMNTITLLTLMMKTNHS